MRTFFHHNIVREKRYHAHLERALLYTRGLAKLVKKNNYAKPESAIGIAADARYQQSITRLVKKFEGVRHVVLVGIGGSNLGAEAVYHALAYKTSPSLTVLEEVDHDSLATLEALTDVVRDMRDIVLVVVSKSGTTTETMANGMRAISLCERRYGKAFMKRVVFVGDADTPFMKVGKKHGVHRITIPDAIGGRYSLFTAVGMVPLALLGIDTISLREGAVAALSKTEIAHISEGAARIAHAAEEGIHAVNFFTFNRRLVSVGYWYRQLLAESIGKTMTKHKTTFAHQLLPVVSTGADLHSMAQLYLGGYRGMFTHFFYYNEAHPHHVLTAHWLLDHMPFLKEKSFDDVREAIKDGVLRAYDDQKLPYAYTELPKCTAYEIGMLFSTLMAEVMTLAHLLDVDAFIQPNVESYKKHTRALLDQHNHVHSI